MSVVRLGFVPSYRFQWTDWTEEMRQASLRALGRLTGVEILAPPVLPEGAPLGSLPGATRHGAVHSLDEAEIVAAYLADHRVDGLVLCPTDFGDERSCAKIAEQLRVPALLYATKEPPAVGGASLARVSDSYCGTLSIAAALLRRKLPFHFAGIVLPEEPACLRAFEVFARAVAVVAGLRNARIGQVGVRPAPFETVAYDEIAMARHFGQNVLTYDMGDLSADARVLLREEGALDATVSELRASVATVSIGSESLRAMAALEIALERFYRGSRLSAMATQCWSTVQRTLGVSLCAVFGRLTGKGLLTACETDVLGALSMLAQHRAAGEEWPPHFIDWTVQHRDDPDVLLAWHCGNAPVCLARAAEETALRSRFDMVGESPAAAADPQAGLYQFQLRPGPVTFCRLAEYDGRWKMLIASGEIVPSDETLAGTWSWVRVPDHARLYRTLVEEGFIHHASMIHGDQSEALHLACAFLDIAPVVVG